MFSRYFLYTGLTAGSLLACTATTKTVQTQKLQLAYRMQDGEKAVDFQASPGWQPQWADSLVARLERGVIPALDQDNKPLPADSLPRARRMRGFILFQGTGGALLNVPRKVRAYVSEQPGAPALSLYFYNQAISLEVFYARVSLAAVETITGRPLELIPAR